MNKRVLCLIMFLISLFYINPTQAEVIKYNFSKGACYSYKYTRQDQSAVSAPVVTTRKTSDSQTIDFIIRVVGYQDNSFILDIGNDKATFRRYISANGDLKGAPSEDRLNFPFFLSFPNGDWKIGSSIKQNTEILAFGKKTPAVWNLVLTKVDSIRNLAEITFEVRFNFQEDRTFTKTITLDGKVIFNMAEGVIHQADWKTNYIAKQICKEIAISRDLWNFQKQTVHTLKLTGVER